MEFMFCTDKERDGFFSQTNQLKEVAPAAPASLAAPSAPAALPDLTSELKFGKTEDLKPQVVAAEVPLQKSDDKEKVVVMNEKAQAVVVASIPLQQPTLLPQTPSRPRELPLSVDPLGKKRPREVGMIDNMAENFPVKVTPLVAGDKMDLVKIDHEIENTNPITHTDNTLFTKPIACCAEESTLPSPVVEGKMSNRKVTGIKKFGQHDGAGPNKKAKTCGQSWKCSLCQVNTTGEGDMKAHLQGKKHKSMVQRLATQTLVTNAAIKKKLVSFSSPEATVPELCDKVIPFPSMPKDNGEVSPMEARLPNDNNEVSPMVAEVEPSTLLQDNASAPRNCNHTPVIPEGKKITMIVEGVAHQVIKTKNRLWCEPCMEKFENSMMMASHLDENHKVRMEELKRP